MVNFPKSYYVFGQLDFTWIPANALPFGTALPCHVAHSKHAPRALNDEDARRVHHASVALRDRRVVEVYVGSMGLGVQWDPVNWE